MLLQFFFNASGMAQEVMLHTHNAYMTFIRSVMNEFVTPLKGFYATSNRKKLDIEKKKKAQEEALNIQVDNVSKERDACLKQISV